MEPGYLVVEVNASEQFTLNLTSASLYCPITIVVRKFGLQPSRLCFAAPSAVRPMSGGPWRSMMTGVLFVFYRW